MQTIITDKKGLSGIPAMIDKALLRQIAGQYHVISPYHSKVKKLPFNIESDGYVSTIEYKGNTAYLVNGFYSLDTLVQLIESGVVKEGKATFPKFKRQS